eukprot:c16416_g2_i2.p1 GENE.c16416_g2_i2~~c16416_g2_i2.p1  ORF type:complete len:257 (-),score=99.11 c16416_g2_i2:33-803(-)
MGERVEYEFTKKKIKECLDANVIPFENTSNIHYQHNPNSFEVNNECSFPDIIAQELAQKPEAVCFMGLLPEIKHAWIAIDTKLYLWNFQAKLDYNRDEVYQYEELDQTITCAGLAPPRLGVLLEEIRYVLVLTTATEIVLLGVCYREVDGVISELILCQTQLSVPADGVHMTSLVSTENGRIFLGGRDGNLYEIVYQNRDGWITSRCRKINHSRSVIRSVVPSFLNWTGDNGIVHLEIDTTRHVLLTLSKQSTIQV